MLPLKRKCNSVARSSINATELQIVSRETPNITPHTKTPETTSPRRRPWPTLHRFTGHALDLDPDLALDPL